MAVDRAWCGRRRNLSLQSTPATELVSEGVAQIGEEQPSRGAVADAGRIFYGGPPVCHARVMPGGDHFGTVHLQANCAPIGEGGWLSVDRPGDQEPHPVLRIDQTALGVDGAGPNSNGGKCRVIELSRQFQIVAADDDVTEHCILRLDSRAKPRTGWGQPRRFSAVALPVPQQVHFHDSQAATPSQENHDKGRKRVRATRPKMGPVLGIAPTYSAWKAAALPWSYTR